MAEKRRHQARVEKQETNLILLQREISRADSVRYPTANLLLFTLETTLTVR